MASGWKRAVEIVLARSGAARALGTLTAPGAVVLAYHNIVPEGETACGDLSLHIDRSDFAWHLDLLEASGRIVGLRDLFRPPHDERLRIAVTFDDAYRGAMTAGVEELSVRGLDATVFVPPGLLGGAGFWWDRLAGKDGALHPRQRDHALSALQGDETRVLDWAASQGASFAELPAHARPVSASELLSSSLYGGITFGAHSWSHPNLAAVPPARLAGELEPTRRWLREHTDRFVDWLAYPYGLRNRTVVEAAARLHEGAFRVDGGFAVRRGRSVDVAHETPRLNVPRGLTPEGLALRLAGLVS